MVRGRGWDADHAESLAAARDLLARAPRWVFLDVMLPDGSGLDLFPAIRRAAPLARVIVLSAAADPAVLAAINANRPTLVVPKPVADPGAVLDALGDPLASP
jgi:DNA-binding response OmpR family regulator